MAKRFTIVNFNDEEFIYLKGFKTEDEITDSEAVLETWNNYYETDTVHIIIDHCLLLDVPEPDEDISDEDLDIVIEMWDSLVEDEHIYLEERAEFDTTGLKEPEIIET